MDNKKVPEVNGVQEHTDKNDAVESVSHDTVDKVEMIEYFSSSHKKFFEGFRKKTKPVGIGDIGLEDIRKIARKLK